MKTIENIKHRKKYHKIIPKEIDIYVSLEVEPGHTFWYHQLCPVTPANKPVVPNKKLNIDLGTMTIPWKQIVDKRKEIL